jgi:Spy/CpxP family protein refolding chaperone
MLFMDFFVFPKLNAKEQHMNKGIRLLLISTASAVAMGAATSVVLAANDNSTPASEVSTQSQAPAGFSPGYGMGPGMMGGYGPGYGMGPGMMGGYGPGYGMGMSLGMMGQFWRNQLKLTDEQLAKIDKIMDETHKIRQAIRGQMIDDRAKLNELYLAPQRDEAAIDNIYQEMAGLREKMFDTALDAHRRMDAVLTPEQRQQVEAIRQRVMGY